MKTLPIDASAVEFRFVECVGVFDRDNGEQKTTRDDKVPLWAVRCLARMTSTEFAGKPEVLEVRVPSRTDLTEVLASFELVKFDGLVARPWAMVNDGRGNDGVTFSATGVSTIKAGKSNGIKPAVAEPVSV